MKERIPRKFTEFLEVIVTDFRCYKTRLGIDSTIKACIYIPLFHPGWQLLFSNRIQEQVGKLPFAGAILRRILWYFTLLLTRAEISHQSAIGAAVYFPHTTGIVIGDSWDVGNNVTIMQGVTLGRKDSNTPPLSRSVVEDGAVICAGAVIVGEIRIGPSSIVGANAVVLQDVPGYSKAVGVPAKILTSSDQP
jgi:serine O-acetyltransferase